MEKGNIGEWNVKVGDAIAPGDVLCSIETDKATIDFEMQDEGYVAKLMYEAGTKDIPLGKVLAILVDEKEDIAAFADYVDESVAAAPTPAAAPAAAPTPAAAAPTPAAASSNAPARQSGDRLFVSPLAAGYAKSSGVDLSTVTGTGPNGRIIKADIDDALARGPAKAAAPVFDSAPAGFGDYVDIENSTIRKVIADRLTYSK